MYFKCLLALISLHFVYSSVSDRVIDCEYINNDQKRVKLSCVYDGQSLCFNSLFYSFRRAANRRNVKVLQITKCRSKHWDLVLFQNFTELQDFDFSSFGVDSFPDALEMRHLRRFNGSHNQIAKIDGSSFRNIPNITEMDLSFNHISILNRSTFLQLSDLRVVNLSDNFIKSIDDGTFRNNIHLTELRLENNPIKRIDQAIFQLVMKSIKVNVSCNSVEELDTSSLKNSLRIELNQENAIFHHSTNEEFEMHCDNARFQSFSYLNISSNKLQNAPQIIDLLGSSVEILDASDNFIGALNSSQFKRWTNLKILNLRKTRLATLDFGIFQHQQNLQVLDVSFNLLKKVEINSTLGDEPFQLTSLHTLILESNLLNEVDNINPSHFPKLTHLNVLKNHFPCNYLTKFVQQSKKFNRLDLKAINDHNQCPSDDQTTVYSRRTKNKTETSRKQSTKSKSTSKLTKRNYSQKHAQLITNKFRNTSGTTKNYSTALTTASTPKNVYFNSSRGVESQKGDQNITVNVEQMSTTTTIKKYLNQSKTMSVSIPTRASYLVKNIELEKEAKSRNGSNATETSEDQLVNSDLTTSRFDWNDAETTEISSANFETASIPNDATEGLEIYSTDQSATESLFNGEATTENYSIESETTADTSAYIQINSTKIVTDIQFSESISGEANTVYHSEGTFQTTTIMKYTKSPHQNWTTKTNRYFNFSISSMAAPKYYHPKSNEWKYFTIVWIIICCIGFLVRSKWARTIGTRLFRGKPIHVPYRLDQQESYLRSVELIHHLDYKELNRNVKKY